MKVLKRFTVLCLIIVMALTVSVPALAATKSYTFTYRSYSRRPGQSVSRIRKKWKLRETSRGNSQGGGQYITYMRKGLRVLAYSRTKGGTEYISDIMITSSKYKTREGIKVGSTLAKLKSRYKHVAFLGNYDYYTVKNGMMILFHLKNGRVKWITYMEAPRTD